MPSQGGRRISVVIPTQDRAAFLERTLACLVPQTLPKRHYEVLVVDDASKDDTARVARSFRRRLPLRYLRREARNAGAARNSGTRKAAGKVVLFLDDECLVRPDFLEAHCRSHERGGFSSVVRGPTSAVLSVWGGSAFNNIKASGRPVAPRAQSWLQGVEELLRGDFAPRFPVLGRKQFYHEAMDAFGPKLDKCPAPWFLFLTRNISIPRGILRESEGFDETLRVAGLEDMELGYRLHRRGVPYFLESKAPCFYQVCDVSKRRKAERLAEHYKRICAKHEDFGIFTSWKLLTGDLDFRSFNRVVGDFETLARHDPRLAQRRLLQARAAAARCGQNPDYLFRNL
jgi:glycosyltransferase involved in cell wall biosynthesis